MEPPSFTEELLDRKVCIVGSELVENYTVYVIEVQDGEHKWTIKHRYSDFHDLHEKLATANQVERCLLPPKKMLGKNSKSLVERRQKELEVYLQTLLCQFPGAVPGPLAAFLHFNLYEINGITAALAEELFHKGEQLLAAGEVFSLRPLQLHAVSRQLRLATPTCCNGDAKTDLGHILDFACRLRYLKICGTRGPLGSSDILETALPFDLSFFKSLLQIEISECDARQIRGLSSLRSTLVTLSIHNSTETMMLALVPEASDFPQWEAEGSESGCAVTAVVPLWPGLTTLDMSHNGIGAIDASAKLLRKVEFLDLSHNQLSSVENLEHLYNLVHLDLSYNNLCTLEAAHTRLGNIKTLSLAGNQLESLAGLGKLYSLVHLDLGHNQLNRLEEIKNIGSLPCLEKLNLSGNPVCIVPDYRTKVLAQFGERAAEVCLDGQATTEKELDTVEVLKAIQKAKEVKDRMSASNKKISEETGGSSLASAPPRLSPPPSSSSSSSTRSSCVAAPPSLASRRGRRASCGSQEEMNNQEESAIPPVIVPPHALPVSHSPRDHDNRLAEDSQASSSFCFPCSSSSSSSLLETTCPTCNATWCPLLPPHLFSFTSTHRLFTASLSKRLKETRQKKRESHTKAETKDEDRSPSIEVLSSAETTEVGSPAVSRDGYFEMGPDRSLPDPSSTRLPDEFGEEEEQEERVNVVLWCYGVKVEDSKVEHQVVCLVLTDNLLGLLRLSDGVKGDDYDADKELVPTPDALLSNLDTELLLPFSELLLPSHADLPAACLHLAPRNGACRYYLFSEPQDLQRTRTELLRLLRLPEAEDGPPLLPRCLLNSWELEESQDARGGYLTLLPPSSASPSDISAEAEELPALLFLTQRHLWVLKTDVREPRGDPCKLVRVPLGSMAVRPTRRCLQTGELIDGRFCKHPQHHQRCGHTAELLLSDGAVPLLFPLARDKTSFLEELSRRRAALGGLKTVVLPLPCRCPPHPEDGGGDGDDFSKPPRGSSGPCLEDNRPSPHLLPALSPGLKLLSGLDGEQLMEYFHRFIALSGEKEEVRQLLWLSVVLYTSPESELACCLLLSTEAVYFLLEDSAAAPPGRCPETDVCLCPCLTIKLSDLLSVNVGLFDQYFRLVGRSAECIVCCLSRDSYGTGVFLQELMSVLSPRHELPAPENSESSEQDFYSEFPSNSAGKMQNYELVHSSRVKFIYPSEEEVGDLTFIVAERKNPAIVTPRSFNVLLYLLVFQVEPDDGRGPHGAPLLRPQTLILTAADVFLLDEDYASYPLPDFAKEPPSRERYRLREARRIRDLDRVLLGYQTYPQALTLVFDDLPGPDLLCRLTADHFGSEGEEPRPQRQPAGTATRAPSEAEVQWCVFVPGADSRERLISVLARQWEALCSRELPVELTG
ncbi:nischarin [Stigmatopora nigra]